MKRSWLAAALAVVLVGTPVMVAAPAAAQPTVPTSVVMHVSPTGIVTFRTPVSIRGQVVYTAEDGHQYAAEGTVVLERNYLGTPTWNTIGTDVMSGFFPSYEFTAVALRNTQYRVRFQGDDTYRASAGWKTVRVARRVTATVTEPRESVFFMSGRVFPAYARKTVALMRKTCLRCAWAVYARTATSAISRYSFRLPNPRGGVHYFRVRVWPNVAYVMSFSPIWTLTRII